MARLSGHTPGLSKGSNVERQHHITLFNRLREAASALSHGQNTARSHLNIPPLPAILLFSWYEPPDQCVLELANGQFRYRRLNGRDHTHIYEEKTWRPTEVFGFIDHRPLRDRGRFYEGLLQAIEQLTGDQEDIRNGCLDLLAGIER